MLDALFGNSANGGASPRGAHRPERHAHANGWVDAALEKPDELGLKVSGYEERARGLEQIDEQIAAMVSGGKVASA